MRAGSLPHRYFLRILYGRGANLHEFLRAIGIKLIDECSEKPVFGFLGEPRVNVLELDLALDRRR